MAILLPAPLERARQRPEMRPLLAGLELSFDAELGTAWSLGPGGAIAIGPSAGNEEAALALTLRLAAETALWLRRLPATAASRVTAALLGGRAGAIAHALMGEAERKAARAILDPDCAGLLGGDQPPEPSDRLAALAGRMLAFQGAGPADPAESLASAALRQGWQVAAPAEVLLTSGGDERLRLDPESGLNRYGCSPRPRPWAITFASTTATSISDGAFAHVEELRRTLADAAAAGRLDQEYAAAMDQARGEILSQCGAIPGTEAILTPSGTDAEFYALHLAMAADDRPLTNIVIAPHETASNVMPAAGGRHYNTTTAMGRRVILGEPVDQASAARVELVTLDVRDGDGRPLPLDAVDAAAERAATAALAAGRRVLLHLLDTSKTGLIAPGIPATCALARRMAGSLDVVVDASQLRLSRDSVAFYLRQGFMVIATGSKFFTGPPFAGTLLVPPAIAARTGGTMLPEGYGAYTERRCWPSSWESYCRAMGAEANLGLLMRWWAALWEMAAFHAVPKAEAGRILETFLAAIGASVAATPSLPLLPCPPLDRSAMAEGRDWDSLPTILTFALLPPGAAAPLGLAEARRVYGWLNRDMTAFLPRRATGEERWLAGLAGHIGQPVVIGPDESAGRCGLRLAAGARLVSGARQAMTAGRSVQAFLDLEIAEAKLVVAKLDMLLRHLDHLRRSAP